MNDIDTIPLDAVRIDGGTQSRVELNEATIAEYADVLRDGGTLPAIVTFFDGVSFWLADGFHRFFAHKTVGTIEIPSQMHDGTCRDAVLYSLSANAAHGLRRTNEDKRKAVQTMLDDSEWSAWSDREIARACAVSAMTVGRIRSICNIVIDAPVVRLVERDGKTYPQNTANIGKKPARAIDSKIVDGPLDPQEPALLPDEGGGETPPPSDATKSALDAGQAQESDTQEYITELQSSLKKALSDNEMMGRVFDADDRLQAAMNEASRQKSIAENAERKFNAQQGKLTALSQAVEHWKRRAEKAEKALTKLGASK